MINKKRTITIAAVFVLVAGACSSGDDSADATSGGTVATTTTAAPAPATTAPPPETTTPPTEPTVATTAVVETTVPEETTTTVSEPECPVAVPNTAAQPAGVVASIPYDTYGLSVDKSGNVYVSVSPLGQIVKFAPGSGEYEVFGQIPDWDVGPDVYFGAYNGILGLAIDEIGHVYAAVDGEQSAGIWKFDCRTGEATRFAGTEGMLFANSVALDDDGNLYATESYSGTNGDVPLAAIWRITPDGVAEKWLENTTLGGPNRFNLVKPQGAKGIAYHDGQLYVNNLQQTSIFTVPILADGSPGEITPYVATENKFIGSGIALDTDGRVYITDVIQNGVLRVAPDGTLETIATAADTGLTGLTNFAFGIGGTELTMYAVGVPYGSLEASDAPVPTLIAIDVDTPGMPLP